MFTEKHFNSNVTQIKGQTSENKGQQSWNHQQFDGHMYIILIRMDGGAFISFFQASLIIYSYLTAEFRRNHPKQTYRECLHTNTAVGERIFVSPRTRLDMTVLNFLSLRNSTRCMGESFDSRKEQKSFLKFNIFQDHFFQLQQN